MGSREFRLVLYPGRLPLAGRLAYLSCRLRLSAEANAGGLNTLSYLWYSVVVGGFCVCGFFRQITTASARSKLRSIRLPTNGCSRWSAPSVGVNCGAERQAQTARTTEIGS